MDMLDRRLNDKGKNWRHVMKALTVLDYIIHTGSENVVLWGKDNLYIIKTLREFQYIDEDGRDQGASIRTKARELTTLLQDDDRLREERLNKSSSSRRRRRQSRARESSPPSRPRQQGSQSPVSDNDIRRALEESRQTAEDDERRRKNMEGSDEDLRKALMLSKEEEQARARQPSLFDSQPNLIDTDDVPVGQLYPQNVYAQNGYGFQQPVATGLLQNAYATGGIYQQQQQQQQQMYPQSTGYQQGFQQGFVQTPGFPQTPGAAQTPGYQQQINGYGFPTEAPQEQQQQQQPLQPLKTGSNNPFAQRTAFATSQPSLNQIANQQSQPRSTQSQPSLERSNTFDPGHMNELNTLLSTGEGIDTFGNVGELRIPAQHTKSVFVNSAGMGMQTLTSNNPFMSQQYTGIATTNHMQPAFTGYGFGNAVQSQQAYQEKRNLIDL
jgi:epsin